MDSLWTHHTLDCKFIIDFSKVFGGALWWLQRIATARRDLKSAKADAKVMKDAKTKKVVESKKKAVQRLEEQLMKLEVLATDREENKQIALGTSKLNYLDPRITVAWCKKWGVPIEKIYNKTQREKFAWAIDMTDEDYEF